MRELIDRLETALAALGCPLYANHTDNLGECAVYKFYTAADNGSRRENSLQLYIRAESMARGLLLEEAADRAIVPLGERPVTSGVTGAARNGGGSMEDGDRHIRIAYYSIVTRA